LSEKYTYFSVGESLISLMFWTALLCVLFLINPAFVQAGERQSRAAQSLSSAASFDAHTRSYQIKKSPAGESEYQLAERYRHKKNFKFAEHYYLMAAKKGNADAHFRLGQMYATGRGSVRSLVEAHMHYNLSSYLGAEKARAAMFALESQMTDDQLERAMNRAVRYRKLNNL
jgi:TPR repeat protein